MSVTEECTTAPRHQRVEIEPAKYFHLNPMPRSLTREVVDRFPHPVLTNGSRPIWETAPRRRQYARKSELTVWRTKQVIPDPTRNLVLDMGYREIYISWLWSDSLDDTMRITPPGDVTPEHIPALFGHKEEV